jgi:3-oxoacyl-[acyl-carrier protein] reductase
MLSIDLSGKCALVTGATSQLGRVMVRTLAQAGADVAVHYHSNHALALQLSDQVQQLGRRSMIVGADITQQADIQAMQHQVADGMGAPDIIVNNAVIQYQWTTVLQQSPSDYESQFRSCVLHNVMMAQAFVPAMIDKGYGRIIGINTECTMQAWPNQSAYISGKAGMDRVMRILAKEVGQHGITVNQVAPGWTVSEDRPDSDSDEVKNYTKNVPLKRRGQAQEIANVVAFLASDLASYMTGTYIPVCGGNVMPAI